MTTYTIEMMTTNNYINYMAGSNNYCTETINVEANTVEEAILFAKNNNPAMIINENYVKTVEEIKAEKTNWEAFLKAEAEKKAINKAKKEAKEKEKADALGLTIEEYKIKVKHDKKVREITRTIEKLEKELAEAKAKLAKLNEK